MLYGVILAGGAGKRLWPESDKETPKPLLSRTGASSLLEETISRILPLIPADRLLISAARSNSEKLRQNSGGKFSLITEPIGRNTAPAIALAALELESRDPNALMAVFPSDHFVSSSEKFRAIISAAADLVDEDSKRLITIGIKPTSPAVGYGYIKAGSPLSFPEGIGVTPHPRQVVSFHEKPDSETALSYLNEGNFFWNAGIFVWQVKQILRLLGEKVPEIGQFIAEIRSLPTAGRADAVEHLFPALPSVSIDKGVLEKAEDIIVLPASFGWNDLGTFEEFVKSGGSEADSFRNSFVGVKLTALESEGNIIRSSGTGEIRFVSLAGISNLLIVRKGEKLMIVPKGRNDLIQHLAESDR